VAFCVVAHFVAEGAKRRVGKGVHVSKGLITCYSRDLMYIRCCENRRGCQTRLNLNFWLSPSSAQNRIQPLQVVSAIAVSVNHSARRSLGDRPGTLGRAPRWEGNQREEQAERRGGVFHGIEPPGSRDCKPIRRRQIVRLSPSMGCVVHKNVEYTAKKFQKSWQGRVQSWR